MYLQSLMDSFFILCKYYTQFGVSTTIINVNSPEIKLLSMVFQVLLLLMPIVSVVGINNFNDCQNKMMTK